MTADSSFIDFEDKWVVVTGATSGIGAAIARELHGVNARVVLCGRNRERLDALASELGDDRSHIMPLDLAEHGAIAPAILDVTHETGPLYGLCNCAGIVATRPLRANRPEVFQALAEINVVAGLELARAVCGRRVLEEDGGSVLFVSSIYGHRGMPGQISYSATKSALYGAVRAMAVELARRNVRVNSISPGLVETNMTGEAFKMLSEEHIQAIRDAHPLGPGTARDVARAAAFLLAPQSVWITGTDLSVDGGYSAK